MLHTVLGLTDVICLPSFRGCVWGGGVHRLSFVFQLSPSPMSQPSNLPTSQGLPLAPPPPKKKGQLQSYQTKNPRFTGKWFNTSWFQSPRHLGPVIRPHICENDRTYTEHGVFKVISWIICCDKLILKVEQGVQKKKKKKKLASSVQQGLQGTWCSKLLAGRRIGHTNFEFNKGLFDGLQIQSYGKVQKLHSIEESSLHFMAKEWWKSWEWYCERWKDWCFPRGVLKKFG